MKQALGIAVSGTEIRLALLTSDKDHLTVEELETATLKTSLESRVSPTGPAGPPEDDGKDFFGIKDAPKDKESSDGAGKHNPSNLEALYRLLYPYTRKKIKVAFNIPISRAHYHRQIEDIAENLEELSERQKEPAEDSSQALSYETIETKHGSPIHLEYEPYPPSLSLLREANEYLSGNLSLALMDTTEMALANLARANIHPEYDKYTAIIYIEDDFTRLVFLKGRDLFHVSSIIHENAGSPYILDVVSRKLFYEQDEAQIPAISKILLAGRSSRIGAKVFFKELFKDTAVGYLSTGRLGNLPLNEGESQNEVFSEYVVPIALAWKLLQTKNPAFLPHNLLPQVLQDQQKIIKLDHYGYALLAITALVAFLFTWKIVSLHVEVSNMRLDNSRMELQISSKNSMVDKVLDLETQSIKVEKTLALTDSLSQGYDQFLKFLQKLNISVGKIGGLWVEEVVKYQGGYTVKGASLNRDKIPLLAEELNGASLKSVTRVEAGFRKHFYFELDCADVSEDSLGGDRNIPVINPGRNTRLLLTKEGSQTRTTPVKTQNASVNDIGALQKRQKAAKRSKPLAQKTTVASSSKRASVTTRKLTASSSQKNRSSNQAVNSGKKKQSNANQLASDSRTNKRAESSMLQKRNKQPTGLNRVTRESVFGPAEARTDRIKSAEPAPYSNGTANKPESQKNDSKPRTQQSEPYLGYTIVAATSYTKSLAEQYMATYRKQGLDAVVVSHQNGNGREQYRVLVGSFASRPAAERKAAQIAGLLNNGYQIIGLK